MHNQCEFFVCLFLCKEEVYGVSVKTVPDVRWKKDPLGYCFVHCGTSGVTPQRLKQLPTRPMVRPATEYLRVHQPHGCTFIYHLGKDGDCQPDV